MVKAWSASSQRFQRDDLIVLPRTRKAFGSGKVVRGEVRKGATEILELSIPG